MNKRIRSRVLAAGMVSSTVLGLGGFPFLQQALLAQDKPTAADQLDRASRLYDDKQYAEAKKILLDIDPAQLPEDQRTKLADLTKNTDVALSKSQGASGAFDAAQADLDAGKLVAANAGFQGVIDDATASSDLKDKAKIQQALVKKVQADKAPQMKELLAQAQSLYDAGKLDDAQSAVGTVIATGSDLGWQDNAKPAQLQQKIADKRAALASAATASTAPAVASAVSAPADATAPATASAVAAAPAPMPMDAPAATMPAAVAAPAIDPNSAMGQTITSDEIARQRALTLYNLAMSASDAAMHSNPPQYAVAIDRAHEAGAVINDNRRYFSDAEGESLRTKAAFQEQAASSLKTTYDAQESSIAANNARETEKKIAEQHATERQRRVDALMRDAKHFVDTQQYKEAADTLRQILVIDPHNSSAELMLSLVTDRIAYRTYSRLMDDSSHQFQKQALQSSETLIPYADLLIYPENWVELSRTRLSGASEQESSASRVVRARLAENIKELVADGQGLEKILNFIRDNTGLNMDIRWAVLLNAGIDKNTAVTVNLHDVPISKALTTILGAVGGTTPLEYTVEDGVITISTHDDLVANVHPVLLTYDVRDLLIQPDNTPPPNLNIQQATQQGSSGGGGGSGLFSDSGQGTQATPQARTDEIVTKIKTAIKTVDPTSWVDLGGSVGDIQEFSGMLLIRQTPENHYKIEHDILQKLREAHAVQISVETRIMFVTNNFFEQFGIGWGATIPAGALGPSAGAITINNGAGGANSSAALGMVGGTISGNGSSVVNSGALSVGGTFGTVLDNFQLNVLIQATQIDDRNVSVSSPRLTLFNGQTASIAVVREQGYISNFNQQINSTGGILGGVTTATTLTTAALNTGVTLTVEAAVSADRRYVVMTVLPTLASNEGFTNIGQLGSSTSGGTLSGIFLQLPNVDVTSVKTSISVPDGGTLLIGGEKILGTSEVEIGVPILSKIPGLNRLFTNRAMEKDEKTLLVLVRPKIIIQSEIEQNLFGTGYDRPTGLPVNPAGPGMNEGNGIDPGFKAEGR